MSRMPGRVGCLLPLVTFPNLIMIEVSSIHRILQNERSLLDTLKLDKVFEDGRADQLGVELSDTVDFAASNTCEVRHAYLLGHSLC